MYDENDLYAELGVEPESQNTQDAADPAQEDQNESESQNTQDAADPAESKVKQEQDAQARHEAAARRRQQQLEEMQRQADERARAELNKVIKAMGQQNPYTGKTVETLEELQQMQQDQNDADIQRDLKAGKLTMDALEKAVNNNPILQKAQKIIDDAEQAKKQANAERENAARQAFQQKVANELENIAKINPKIKTVEDILAMPTGTRFAELVQKNGLSFEDAYRLANIEDFKKLGQAAAMAQNAQKANKDHLQGTNTRGEGNVSVPADVKEQYRLFDPSATDEEIAAHYNEFYKRTKG